MGIVLLKICRARIGCGPCDVAAAALLPARGYGGPWAIEIPCKGFEHPRHLLVQSGDIGIGAFCCGLALLDCPGAIIILILRRHGIAS